MDLSVSHWGTGPGRALLVHGISSNADGWWRVGPAVAEMGYEVVAPDLRGHGTSGPGDEYTLAAYARDLVELGSEWDLVLGHSLGGAAVTLAAVSDPSFAKKIILEDPALVIPDTASALEWLLEPFAGEVTAESVAAASPGWHPEDARIKAEALRQSGAEPVRRTVADNEEWNVLEAAMSLKTPTLLVGADPSNGAILPPALGESLAASNPALRFVWIPKGSHSIHRDEFDAFMAAVEAFVATP